MANVWRSLTEKELTGGKKHEIKKFGAFTPNNLQRFLIKLGRNSILRRGVFRGTFTSLILSLTKGPLDITFRDCSYRIWGRE